MFKNGIKYVVEFVYLQKFYIYILKLKYRKIYEICLMYMYEMFFKL